MIVILLFLDGLTSWPVAGYETTVDFEQTFKHLARQERHGWPASGDVDKALSM